MQFINKDYKTCFCYSHLSLFQFKALHLKCWEKRPKQTPLCVLRIYVITCYCTAQNLSAEVLRFNFAKCKMNTASTRSLIACLSHVNLSAAYPKLKHLRYFAKPIFQFVAKHLLEAQKHRHSSHVFTATRKPRSFFRPLTKQIMLET